MDKARQLVRGLGRGAAAAALTLALTLALAPAALAANVDQSTNPGTASTTVSAQVDTSYLVSIPADVTFTQNQYDVIDRQITATGVRIPGSKTLKVSLASTTIVNGGFVISNGSDQIACEMSGDGTHDAQGYALDFASNAKGATTVKNIKFNVKADEWSKALTSGTYRADLVFSIALV
jgi:hypothetical protein